MTLGEARTEGAAVLAREGADSPALDASLLLAHATGLAKERLLVRAADPIGGEALKTYRRLIERRAGGVCVAYLTGRKEFMDRVFRVTPSVLVPRPDTEILVEAALAWIDARESGTATAPRILDVCTGSGCVAVSLKAERPALSVAAGDLSQDALAVARSNARLILGADGDLIDFRHGDLLAPFGGPFDLIVSNPPYIPSADIDGLAPEVRGEPRMALDGGEDGLDIIRRLVAEAAAKLVPGGRLILEAGHDQAEKVAALMRGAGFVSVESAADLSGIARATGGTKP